MSMTVSAMGSATMEEHINARKLSAFVDAVVFRVLNARLLF